MTAWELSAELVRQAFRLAPVSLSETELVIGGVAHVCSWEAPIQSALAEFSIPLGRDVLEIGYGIGLCSGRLKMLGPRSHWILEAHPIVAQLARVQHPEANIVEVFWEDFAQTSDDFHFGSIIFDAYPLDLVPFNGSIDHCRKFVEQAILAFQRFLTGDGRGTVIDFSCALEKDERLHHAAAAAGLGFEAARIQVTVPEDCEYAAGSEACVLVFSKLGDEKCGLPSDL